MGELHFVDAPMLYDGTMDGTAGMDAWVTYFEDLNSGEDDGSLDFNAFMHNKIQLYTADLDEFDTKFRSANDGAGLPTLKRQSVDSSGAAVAHLGIAISGRMFELVGPLSSVRDEGGWWGGAKIGADYIQRAWGRFGSTEFPRMPLPTRCVPALVGGDRVRPCPRPAAADELLFHARGGGRGRL